MDFDTFQRGVHTQMTEWGENLRSVHESFKGNGAYDSLLKDLERIDWATISHRDINNVATTVVKESTKKGINVGRSFLSTFHKSLDPSGGALVTAGEMLLDWGTDMLYSNMWGEDVDYRVGDIVVIIEGPLPKTELRRRMVGKDGLATGIVVGEKKDGLVGVFNTKSRRTEERDPNSLKRAKAPPGTLNHISQALHEIGEKREETPTQVFHEGDVVRYGKQTYVVKNITVEGDLEVQHLAVRSTDKGSRPSLVTKLVKKSQFEGLKKISAQIADGFFPGQILWFPSDKVEGAKFEAGVVKHVNPETKSVVLYSLWDGRIVREPYHKLYLSSLQARQFPGFVTEVLRPTMRNKFFAQIVPGRTDPSRVTTNHVDARDIMGYPPKEIQNPITTRLPPARSPSVVEISARINDKAKDVYQGHKVERLEEQPKKEKKEDSNMLLLGLGAAGVILFLATR